MPFGVWTICIHLEDYRGRKSQALRNNIETNRTFFTSVQDIHRRYGERRKRWVDAGLEILVREAKRMHLRLQTTRNSATS
jgi:hypothetical protein